MSKGSRNLEVVSSHPDSHSGLERRRVPRLNLAAEQFLVKDTGKVYSISDLSVGGMAVRILEPADLAVFTAGRKLQGTINLHREKFPVSVQVRHVREDLAGLQFLDLPGNTTDALKVFLDPAVLGQELRAMPSSTDESAFWFHGPTGTDILLWRAASGNFGRMAVFIFGTYVQWDPESGLSTGRALPSEEHSEVRGAVRFDTLLLDPDSKPDPAKLSVAKTLVQSASMPQDVQAWCLRQIESKDS